MKYFKRSRNRGMTLIELMVAMTVLLLLGLMLLGIMSAALRMWNVSERQRKVYARTRTVMSFLQDDLESMLTRNPNSSMINNRMFCYRDTAKIGRRQVLMLCRSFGKGIEKSFAFRAGDGLDVVDWPQLKKKINADDEDSNPFSGKVDEEKFNFIDDDGDGRIDEDLEAGRGNAQVVYYHQGRQLFRGFRSPANSSFQGMMGKGQVIADNVLYFGLLFATPYTTRKEISPPGSLAAGSSVIWDTSYPPRDTAKNTKGPFGPEQLWDSTRGLLQEFSFFVDAESAFDGEDDVFPEVIRVTLVVEPHELRTKRTDIREDISDSTLQIHVASSNGFPAPGCKNSYILIEDEWMHYSAMDSTSFIVSKNGRGARGTVAAYHQKGSGVKCGTTFVRTIYIPGHRHEVASPLGSQ
jgi:prepilin-type N-terminal cleavage/methylation domain-containing protein